MERYELDPKVLKTLFSLEGKVGDAAFKKLVPFLDLRQAKRKIIIRDAGAVENESRFLVKGLIGMYYTGKLSRLYFPGDVFMDFESYQTQIPSKYHFKALGDSVYISLSYHNEELLLKEIPDFTDFSKSQIAKVRNADFEWHAFTQMNYRDKIRVIEEKFPSFKYDLTNKEKASLLGVSYATAARIKSFPKIGKVSRVNKQLEKLLKCPFPAYVHNDAVEIEDQSVSWAINFHSIFRNNEEVDYYKKQKLSYLSSCLYPEIDFEKGVWISKLYLWLFYLDDMTDNLPVGQKANFWSYLLNGIEAIINEKQMEYIPSRIFVYLNAFVDLATEFKEMVTYNTDLMDMVFSEVLLYLKYNKAESEHKDSGHPPSLDEYRQSRPYFSGGNLALALCSFESVDKFKSDGADWLRTDQLRQLGAKLIYLSNDLISYNKEESQGDFMNIIALLMHHKKMDFTTAQQAILDEHAAVLEEFMKLDRIWRDEFRPENNGVLKYLKQIKYKIAGSVHWSLSISSRYKTT
ncbi:CRP-like cAMP-binding protein [Algoriphagus ratkowskyi]|uniref:Terpene synthase n=1 Tax=Algoriphagus ratkowskyi TaxID=57028 RepID=A0A2W7R9L5_9BACT|nr:terpene synthase family protein [Algoriphagus ratkowskyi]PZX57608.1 CRP-like cAMP-binding protein [Algoriphagus ratkowskyi]TXD78882.1 hypothetical protein ESW18_05015 [Algoriphagus ratkowskyi]